MNEKQQKTLKIMGAKYGTGDPTVLVELTEEHFEKFKAATLRAFKNLKELRETITVNELENIKDMKLTGVIPAVIKWELAEKKKED